jgi:hypothetical protein
MVYTIDYYHNPSLGLVTKSAEQKCNLGVTFTLSGMQVSVKEWTHIFPNGLLVWELKSRWTSKFLDCNLKGQNSLDWKVPYTIEKLLKFRCLKWAQMIHLSA